jgi:hypothetical protein
MSPLDVQVFVVSFSGTNSGTDIPASSLPLMLYGPLEVGEVSDGGL